LEIISLSSPIPKHAQGCSIALGNFDGIHKGHQEIIAQTLKIAKNSGTKSAVMTFEPHPVSIFNPKVENFRLTTLAQKARRLAELGVDFLFAVDFDEEFAATTAEKFIQDILADKLAVSNVIIGYDFIFGHKRGGNGEMLKSMADKCGYAFTQIAAIGQQGEIFSSTKIRQKLQAGDLAQVKFMLGHNYVIAGYVERGENRGKGLGFPTININSGDMLRPKSGVYAVKISLESDSKIFKGVANIGTKPTFGESEQTLEVHIFDFDKDIYGTNVEIEFIEYIRDERKFADIAQLQAQIANDCEKARGILS
jgi:riboflavin kinase/FMN adenylyltransferase